jgi:hypothetical protein
LFFLQKQDRNENQVLSRDWYQCKRGGYKERVWEGKYSGNIMYLWMQMENHMRSVETVQEWGEGRIKESDGGVNLCYIVRTFVNVTMYPEYPQPKW